MYLYIYNSNNIFNISSYSSFKFTYSFDNSLYCFSLLLLFVDVVLYFPS